MGEGVIVEQGTHQELLRDGNSAYSRLVEAQRLRERQVSSKDTDGETAASAEDMEEAAQKEVPLGRKYTGHSLASEIIEKKRQAADAEQHKTTNYSLPYLFMRMGKLNRDVWHKYVLGTLCAISKQTLLCLLR
jgi:ATP-binding cassette subfamily B (MDR/TAP) protein 1